MKIGVIIRQEILAGGGFIQSLSTLLLLKNNKEYNFYFYSTNKKNIKSLEKYGINAEYIPCSFFSIAHGIILKWPFVLKVLSKYFQNIAINPFEKSLIKRNIDLLYFTSPTLLCLLINKLNYILTVWDLCHRDFPEFPEIRAPGEFEIREKFYEKALKKAFAITVDSNTSKINLLKRYGIDEKRINILPFVPTVNINKPDNININIRSKYSISGNYIIYPAHFWAHKNHIYILEALFILKKEYNIEVSAVFTGSDKGNIQNIKKAIKKLNLEKQIIITGFVPADEIYFLYKESIALVMPTYFGPTNLPPIEAFKLEIPVFYSDLPGLREQVKDIGFLINLQDPSDLSNQLRKLILNEINVQPFIKKGVEKVNEWTNEDYCDGIIDIVRRFEPILKTWKY